jgi:hypothetical protein
VTAAGTAKGDTPAQRVKGSHARGRRSPNWRAGSGRDARQYPLPWPSAGDMPAHQGKHMGEALWERLQDDRDLIRLKTTLLVSLVILAGVLEWVI